MASTLFFPRMFLVLGFANYAQPNLPATSTFPKGTDPNLPAHIYIHVAEGDIASHNTTMVVRHPPKNTHLTRDSG
jgi:hypothetical protein